ncbi:MAG: hypothetical protein ABIO24_13010 [Saprospiraceae bacterium]
MKTLSAFFQNRASWPVFFLVLVIYLLFPAFLLPNAEKAIHAAAGKDVGIIDLGMGFDPAAIQQQVADYGPAGRALYRHTELTIDIAYPLTYAVFFTLLLTLAMRGLPLSDRLRQANVLPFLMWGFDMLENACIVWMLSAYPEQSNLAANLCAVFRLLKWLCFAAVVGLLLFLIGKRLFRSSLTSISPQSD